jgi:NAD(P)H-flavin reductase
MDAITPIPYRVVANDPETAETRTLRLEPADGDRILYAPGQFAMTYAFGAGEVPISISGDPDGSPELVQTIRAVGAATRSLCELGEGEEVGIRGPFGRGWPPTPEPEGDLLLVAGGLGLAPLRPALLRALRHRAGIRRLVLLYGGREPAQLLFRPELERWLALDELDCELIVDIARSDWRGRVGVVPSLIERIDLEPAATTAMICGPEVMMRFSAEALLRRGVAASSIHVSLERNMRCAVGHCGHCQWGGDFICRDGPVFAWEEISDRIGVREL